MHNLHCHRNVRLCKKCEEPVPISEMEAHEEEYHAMVECKCKAKIEKGNLEDHEVVSLLFRSYFSNRETKSHFACLPVLWILSNNESHVTVILMLFNFFG